MTMAVIKRSISLDADVAQAIERQAAAEGVAFSTWLNEAARRALKRTQGLAGVRAAEAEIGPFSEEGRAEARRVLRELGVIPTEPS